MDLRTLLTVTACSGHLAFAILAWRRRGHSRVAPLLVLLFLDVAIWNLAELIGERSGSAAWRVVDRGFSSFMPALALHVVVVFIGRTKPLRRVVLLAYACFGSLAALTVLNVLPRGWWWKLLLVTALSAMLYATQLLGAHLRRTAHPEERVRTRLFLLAIAVATLVSSTDLWANKVGLSLPRLSNLGTLAAMLLVATAALRVKLFGRELVPVALMIRALAFAVVSVVGCLAAVHWLGGVAALWALGVLCAVLLTSAALTEYRQGAEVVRERSRRLALVGRLSEQLAHDLRNPLGTLKGVVQFLRMERREGRSIDTRDDFLELMLEQCERLERAVIDYQRLGKIEPLLAHCSLNDVVRQVLALQAFGINSDITLRTRLDEALPRCRIDRDLVAGALENLLRNACEAMPDGGSIEIRTELGATAEAGSRILLCVDDDGPGIDPRLLERATEEFFTTKPSGSGLGLAFAERVAKAHGGGLSLDSDLGSGTRVRLSFPIG